MPRVVAVVNPNSSQVVTDALARTLEPLAPAGTTLRFLTAPPDAPPSINDPPTSVLSAAACFRMLVPGGQLADGPLAQVAGVVVCCFSDHPLVPMLRHVAPALPVVHILEAAVLHALALGNRVGILTTGAAMVPDLDAGVRRILGGASPRYAGCIATGLGVVELQTGDRAKVDATVRHAAAQGARQGMDVIVLGCAGMTGMEGLVQQGVREAGRTTRVPVVDGSKAGVHLVGGIAACHYWG